MSNNSRVISSSLFSNVVEDNINNFKVIKMSLNGFSTDAISAATKMSHGQVQYRVRLYKLQGARRSYRNGITPHAIKYIKKINNVSAAIRRSESREYQLVRDNVLAACCNKIK